MLDMLTLRTKLPIDEKLLTRLVRENNHFRFNNHQKGFKSIYFLAFDDKKRTSPFKLFYKRSLTYDGLHTTLEVNPSKFNSILGVDSFIDLLFPDSNPTDFKVSRIDFAADILVPFHKIQSQVYRPWIRQHRTFSFESGRITGIVLGKPPIEAKVYDKEYEQSLRSKNTPKGHSKDKAKGKTRFEVKVLRKGNMRFLIDDYSQIRSLLDHDPFKVYRFKEAIPYGMEDTKENLNRIIVSAVINTPELGGMAQAYKIARTKLGVATKFQSQKLFKDLDPPDLFSIHRNEFDKWLNPKEHVKQDLGGGLTV